MRLQEYSAHKDPDSDIDYGRNWGNSEDGEQGWLHENEVIITSNWFITCDTETIPTLVISSQGTGISADKKITSVYLEGGTAGKSYKLTNEITTLDGSAANRTEKMTGVVHCCKK